MRANNLEPKELLELDPDRDVFRGAGQRSILLDAVARNAPWLWHAPRQLRITCLKKFR